MKPKLTFNPAHTCYGRSADIENMVQAFQRIQNGSTEIIIISGSSGVGKSSLIHSFQQKLADENLENRVIIGKCDILEQNIPYYPIIEAFESVIQNLLNSNDETAILTCKTKLLAAVGSMGKILTDLIPSMEKLIGEQPPMLKITGKEAVNRFNYALQQLVKTIASEEYPLVLFLDDLQWADSASLSLIENLTNNLEIKHLLFVGAYRDDEISPNHPLQRSFQKIEERSLRIGKRITFYINLHNLPPDLIKAMINDAFIGEIEEIDLLTDIIYKKTGGNPFFTYQLLLRLYEGETVSYDSYYKKWCWDAQKLNTVNLSDNVVALMLQKIQTLPKRTRDTLKIAACLGRQFSLESIEKVNDRLNTNIYDVTFNATFKDLKKAEQEGLILLENGQYQFAHDKIHQAVHSLNSEIFQKKIYLHIGRLLFKKLVKGSFSIEIAHEMDFSSDEIFNLINYWNKGIIFIENQLEISQLATLNLIAGQKAAATAAYEAALNYLGVGISLLYENSWKKEYKLSLALYSELMEVEFLSGSMDKLDQRFDYIVKNVKTPLDAVKAYEVNIQAASAKQQLQKAMNLSLEILAQLGLKYPRKTTKLHFFWGLFLLKKLMFRKDLKALSELPAMTDAKTKGIMSIFQSLAVPIYLGGSNLLPLYIYKGLKHVFKYGNSDDAIFAYGGYGLLSSIAFKDYKTGLAVSDLLDSLIQKYGTKHNSFAGLVKYSFLLHPKISISQLLPCIKKDYYAGLETGEVEFTAHLGFVYIYFSFFRGTTFALLIQEVDSIIARAREHGQELVVQRIGIYRQTFVNLQTIKKDPVAIEKLPYMREELNYSTLAADKMIIDNQLLSSKMMLSYFFGKYENAAIYALENEKNLSSSRGSFMSKMFNFYAALSFCTAYANADSSKHESINRSYLAQKIKKYGKILQADSASSPDNFLNKHKLIQAESFRIHKKTDAAKEAYRIAILCAEKEDFTSEIAISYELSGQFYLEQKEIATAKTHLQKAVDYYNKWEAFAKVAQLKKRYADYLG